MASKTRVIIDTDPGVDDILAILLALASNPEEIEVLLLSVTYGNINVQNCLRNLVSLFHVIEKELQWRRDQGLSEGFEAMKRCKPIIAVGAERPLGDQLMMADYFHGKDGLGGVHSSHPHHTATEASWRDLFKPPKTDTLLSSTAARTTHTTFTTPTPLFTPCHRLAHHEILRILEENPPDTITIIAIGPLTNLALAAHNSPTTLIRAKSILIMGGAVDHPGNMTPVAEFNTYADTSAAARLFALTSPDPGSTMPPLIAHNTRDSDAVLTLPPYPSKLALGNRRLQIVLFPLDITTPHLLYRKDFEAKVAPLLTKGSPLAEWTSAFLGSTFQNMEKLYHRSDVGLSLHDPMCVWYALTAMRGAKGWDVSRNEDIRIETAGQWTRGMCVVDRRGRKRTAPVDDGEGGEKVGDKDMWLSTGSGNRLSRCVGSSGEQELAPFLLDRIFG